jgi:hypothetical protein
VQNIVDAGDPLNFIVSTVAQRAIYLQQVVGGSGNPASLPDQVVPNSSTARLIAAAGAALPRVPPSPHVGSGYVNFVAGDHGSILLPNASAAATVEMQTEMVTFTASGNPPAGASSPTINVVNAAVVQP